MKCWINWLHKTFWTIHLSFYPYIILQIHHHLVRLIKLISGPVAVQRLPCWLLLTPQGSLERSQNLRRKPISAQCLIAYAPHTNTSVKLLCLLVGYQQLISQVGQSSFSIGRCEVCLSSCCFVVKRGVICSKQCTL